MVTGVVGEEKMLYENIKSKRKKCSNRQLPTTIEIDNKTVRLFTLEFYA